MIEKMLFVNIMGNMNDIDRVISKYISGYEIQLESALKNITTAGVLESCLEENPYTSYLQKGEKFAKATGLNLESRAGKMDVGEAKEIIDSACVFFDKRDETLKQLEEKVHKLKDLIAKLEPYINMDFEISSLVEFEFIKYRFGKMPIVNYKQFSSYVYTQQDILFIEAGRDDRFVYGVYFVPVFSKDKVDTVLTSLYFQRVKLPFAIEDTIFLGTPRKAYNMLNDRLDDIQKEIEKQHAETIFTYGASKKDTINAYATIKKLSDDYSLRSFAGKTHNDFYIFIGWMPEDEARRMEQDMEQDGKVIFVIEDIAGNSDVMPPTKLKNNFLVKPFEFFVKTYGLPKYNEIDPTPFVAITYFILFGAMFGDLGQGAVISILGFLLYKYKKMALGQIMGLIGVSSMVFGIMYGSVFGFEEIIPALWMRPFENITDILIIAVCIGVILIVMVMIINMINAIRQRDIPKLLLDPNGLCGLVFYGSVIGIVLSVLLGKAEIATGLIIVFIIIPLIIIAFRVPIGQILEKKKAKIESGKGMFLLETGIELFEVLLTYFTNTVSFVRVGAFALSHAGMMSVVLLMAENINGYNPVVIVLGNILVMAMEGLVVGIQVLRIEFHELFSRYYEGGGKEFIPTRGYK